ncbi:MAG: 3'-5' exonuclease [Candidatus Eremiobacteraeota bacterium]|nr:3'-5' exonuclease [Candidatus Eremiobacteraeota bacterium]NNM93494.1 3'-5' exonuclease [Candidatus Eremiobacteraeota bacterium]
MRLRDVAIFILDVETTGIDTQTSHLCEIGIERWLPPGYTGPIERTRWSSLVRPPCSIPSAASAIHGIYDSDVRDAPPLAQVLATFRKLVPAGSLVVAHNIAFDGAFVDLEGRYRACTLRLAQRLWPNAPSHKNSALALWLGVELGGERLHRAAADAAVTGGIFHRILARMAEIEGSAPTLEQICRLSSPDEPVGHLPFGKHRGEPLGAVPVEYLRYARDSWHDVEPGIRTAIIAEIERRA